MSRHKSASAEGILAHLRTGDESEFYTVWTCITVTELPPGSLLQRICPPSRGSELSTKEEHKSRLNYYSTHEIDFCEKNRRGKEESSPSFQTKSKTAVQPFDKNFQLFTL